MAYLPAALSVALRPSFSFQLAQYAQVFPLKPAPSCKLFAGLCSTNKSATSFLFFYLTLVLSSPPSFLLPQSLCQIWQELFSLLFYEATMGRGHSADELARRGRLLVSYAIPFSLSPLICRNHSCFFSDWMRTVSSKFFDTQAPLIFTEKLVLLRHTGCVLSRLRCNEHSLFLRFYFSIIGRT